MKKPHPMEYGFADASGIQIAIAREEKRKAIVTLLGRLSFSAVVLISMAPVILLPQASLALRQLSIHTLMPMVFVGFISVSIGIGIGLFVRLGARSLTNKLIQPSPEFSKARQYINANRTWRQYIQREYGYDS